MDRQPEINLFTLTPAAWKRAISCAVMAGAISIGARAKADPVISSSVNSQISPAVESALQDFSSDNYGTRKKALEKLKAALAAQSLAIAAVDDPESSQQILDALRFSEGLNGWLMEWLKFPKEQRDAEFQVLSRKDLLPVLTKIFGGDPEQAVAGVKELNALNPQGVDALLAHLVYHSNRDVALAAMEALWDRKPTQPVINALWQRAVPASLSAENWHQLYRQDAHVFRGRPIAGTTGKGREETDGNIACEVLIHLHESDPAETEVVTENLRTTLKDAADAAGRFAATSSPDDQWYTRDAMANVYHLAEAYRPAGVEDFLYTIATSPQKAAFTRTVGMGQSEMTWCKVSTRISAMGTLLILKKEDPANWGLHIVTGWNLWGLPAVKDETALINSLTLWWEKQKH